MVQGDFVSGTLNLQKTVGQAGELKVQLKREMCQFEEWKYEAWSEGKISSFIIFTIVQVFYKPEVVKKILFTEVSLHFVMGTDIIIGCSSQLLLVLSMQDFLLRYLK